MRMEVVDTSVQRPGSFRAGAAPEAVAQSADAARAVTVAEAAHRLKGTAASIRSPRLGEISAALERAATAPGAPISEALMAELRAAVDALIADVEKHSKVLATIG